ncbi:Adenylate cyclase type 1 [Varanus komodoensis]|nr:Adenylate cyclase type 1 [Varanus komodoensis]
MDSTKRQKDMTPEDEPLRSEGVQYATGEEQRASTSSARKNEATGSKPKGHSVADVSGGERRYKEIEENNRIGRTRELFKKIGDMKGTFHAKMGMIKDQNGRDLTEAEEIKKRWQDYTEELYKKELNIPDNHDVVGTDLKPDILECEVKWALGKSEEELKSLLMRVKEESAKVGLKLNIKKTKIMASGPLTSWQIDGEEMEEVTDFIFLGSKITADGDCSQEIKRHLLLGRKAMANLDSILKSRDITLPTKVCIVKAMVFPVAMYGCESWTIWKTEHKRIEAFGLWCWRRLLRVPWAARRSNRSVLEEINLDCSLEGQIVKMKLKYFGHLMRRKDSLEKSLMLGTIDGKRRRGRQRMRWLDGVTEAVGVSLSALQKMVEDRKAWRNAEEERDDMERVKLDNKRILFNLLPAHVAQHFLMSNPRNMDLYYQSYSQVGVMFASIPNFNDFYIELDGNNMGVECLRLLNEIIADFDELMDKEYYKDIEKIKTIGSTYMAAVGLVPTTGTKAKKSIYSHLSTLADFAIEMFDVLDEINYQSYNDFVLRVAAPSCPSSTLEGL